MRALQQEVDAYLVGIADNFAQMRSEVIIADAMNLETEEIARVILLFRTKGLHGLRMGDARSNHPGEKQ